MEDKEQELRHYYDMGILEGKRHFSVWDFIHGLVIGFTLGIIVQYFINH